MCSLRRHKLTLREEEVEIPYFGRVFVLSMDCSACGYRKLMWNRQNQRAVPIYFRKLPPEADLSIKIIKSAEATVKFQES